MSSEIVIVIEPACMPSSNKFGRYGKVGLVEVIPGSNPRTISNRASGVIKVLKVFDRLHVGKTNAGAFQRKIEELKKQYPGIRIACGKNKNLGKIIKRNIECCYYCARYEFSDSEYSDYKYCYKNKIRTEPIMYCGYFEKKVNNKRE